MRLGGMVIRSALVLFAAQDAGAGAEPYSEEVGRVHWLYRERSFCRATLPPLFSEPAVDARLPAGDGFDPVKVQVVELVWRGTHPWFRVRIKDRTEAFMSADSLLALQQQPNAPLHERCVLQADPEARASLLQSARAEADQRYRAEVRQLEAEEAAKAQQRDQRAKRPGVRLGMTPSQVRDRTSWGPPVRINRTVMKDWHQEQWVYPGGYLYFTNGKLTAIQN